MSRSEAGPAATEDTVPRFSVIVPAYNQAAYLREALHSVFAQTLTDYEVVVVNDGSTDDTEAVIAAFADRPSLRVVRQDNQGLAAARNAGIRQTRGSFIALLDADDAWYPSYLSAVDAAILRHQDADVFYCAARLMDDESQDLPQLASVQIVPPEDMYATLLRANFLLPSAVVMRRCSVEAVGMFDPDYRRIQDWELWLRMLRHGMRFIGLNDVLVRYRVHANSLSSDVLGGKAARLAALEKHFGLDDGRTREWSPEKRRAYGGHYRFAALASMARQSDPDACARQLRRALEIDETLAVDASLFYELALGRQPLGHRGTSVGLDPIANGRVVDDILAIVFAPPISARLAAVRSTASATAYRELAKVARLAGDLRTSRHFAVCSLAARRRLALNPDWWRIFLRSFAPSSAVRAVSAGPSRIIAP